MTNRDIFRVNEYLPPQYTAQLESMQQIGLALEPRTGVSAEEQLRDAVIQSVIASNGTRKLLLKETKGLPNLDDASPSARDRIFKLSGYIAVFTDEVLKSSIDMTSFMGGSFDFHSPDKSEEAYEIGHDLIAFRAKYATSAVLRSVDTIFRSDKDQPESTWHRSIAGGPLIRDREWRRFNELYQSALDAPLQEGQLPFKPSRFNAINLIRALKHARAMAALPENADDIALLRAAKDLIGSVILKQPMPLELSTRQIVDVMGTITKIMKHVHNSARTDRTIASDPAARHLAFMLAKLRGSQATNTELMAFKRRAQQVVAQLSQSAEQVIPDAYPSQA